jgi:hypothetical protein
MVFEELDAKIVQMVNGSLTKQEGRGGGSLTSISWEIVPLERVTREYCVDYGVSTKPQRGVPHSRNQSLNPQTFFGGESILSEMTLPLFWFNEPPLVVAPSPLHGTGKNYRGLTQCV